MAMRKMRLQIAAKERKERREGCFRLLCAFCVLSRLLLQPARKMRTFARGSSFPFATIVLLLALLLSLLPASAEDKINYTDHILPLVEANCSKCHNPDRHKADLDLTSYQAALKGSADGAIVVSGNVDSSKLWKSLTHAEEPFMPPNRPKLADKDLDTFRKWIADGLLETAGGKAIAAAKPEFDLALKPEDLAKPEGPPPMPKEWPSEPVIHTARMRAITGLAASPWAPLVAVAGQQQILVYNSDTLELLGIVPFGEGEPVNVTFSRNGKLLLASGGRGAKSGRVVLWDVVSGEHLMTLGQEYDTVLAADLRPDQSQVALGGPGRLVKLLSTETGELLHKMKKHTDWVTALAYSPNGQILASADRNGGISLWDPDSGQELFTLAGHKAAVTALSWRADSKLLASSSEDGTVKLWETQEGKQVKSWNAHGPGVLCVSYGADGRLVTCGRDNEIKLWNANGSKVRQFHLDNIPIRVVLADEGKRVVACNFVGRVAVWSAADGKLLGELDANPPPLAEQLALARKKLEHLQAQADAAGERAAAAQAELAKPEAELAEAQHSLEAARKVQTDAEGALVKLTQPVTNAPPDLNAQLSESTNTWKKAVSAVADRERVLRQRQESVDKAREAVTKAKSAIPEAALAETQNEINRLQAAQFLTAIYEAREHASAAKREHDAAETALKLHQADAQAAQKKLAAAQDTAAKAQAQLTAAQAEIARTSPLAQHAAEEQKTSEAELQRLLNQYHAAIAAPQKLADQR